MKVTQWLKRDEKLLLWWGKNLTAGSSGPLGGAESQRNPGIRVAPVFCSESPRMSLPSLPGCRWLTSLKCHPLREGGKRMVAGCNLVKVTQNLPSTLLLTSIVQNLITWSIFHGKLRDAVSS